jgi:hypothetical protein
MSAISRGCQRYHISEQYVSDLQFDVQRSARQLQKLSSSVSLQDSKKGISAKREHLSGSKDDPKNK